MNNNVCRPTTSAQLLVLIETKIHESLSIFDVQRGSLEEESGQFVLLAIFLRVVNHNDVILTITHL